MIVKRNDEMSDSVESKVFFFIFQDGCVERKLKLFIVAHGKEECGFVRKKKAMGNGEERNLTIVQFGG